MLMNSQLWWWHNVLLIMALFTRVTNAEGDSIAYLEEITNEMSEESIINEQFSQQYLVKDEAFITPKTHPYLFSFTGRWNRRRDVYTASKWPGTSVSMLVYGESCKVKIQCPQETGIVEGHYLLASLENGPQIMLTLPTYNASENQEFEVTIELSSLEDELAEVVTTNSILTPHLLELVSASEYPIKLLGVTIQNIAIDQGRGWLKKQKLIPSIEYISDKRPEHPVLNKTNVYAAARDLGLHQSYIVDYNVCFTNNCTIEQLGLSEEYNYFEPFQSTQSADGIFNIPNYYVFNRQDAFVMTREPDFIVVDVGDNDIAHNVEGTQFLRALQMFLGNIIINTRPDANIFVLIKNGRYVKETENAIVSMHYDKLHAVKYERDSKKWFKSFYCSYVVPLAHESYPHSELCGSAYEQLIKSKSDDYEFNRFWLLIFLAGAMYSIFIKRNRIASYVGFDTNQVKISQSV